jgi:hypothetical protein
MTAEHDNSGSGERRLHAVLHSYLQAVDAGQATSSPLVRERRKTKTRTDRIAVSAL